MRFSDCLVHDSSFINETNFTHCYKSRVFAVTCSRQAWGYTVSPPLGAEDAAFDLNTAKKIADSRRRPGLGFCIQELASLVFRSRDSALIVADPMYFYPFKFKNHTNFDFPRALNNLYSFLCENKDFRNMQFLFGRLDGAACDLMPFAEGHPQSHYSTSRGIRYYLGWETMLLACDLKYFSNFHGQFQSHSHSTPMPAGVTSFRGS